jgi:predicted nucleotidyltransferase component of viral defense system
VIPQAYITEWRSRAPWAQNAWVEQDLIIGRALVEIFRVPELAERLAFRGGTALYRLYLLPAARYSVDWDFDAAMEDVLEKLIARLPGEPWKGV